MDHVTEEKADTALHYLISTSEDHAQAVADSRFYYGSLKETTVDLLRETEAEGYLNAEGSQEVRKHTARNTDDYKEIVKRRQEILEAYRESEYRRQRLENGREAARTTLSLFQSMLRHQHSDGM